jgi:uncharacterized protein YecE (DUF72 family)
MSSTSGRMMLGTAGWNVPISCREYVGGDGSHLERYARALNAVEINTSFYRPHRLQTYERWAAATPDDFRFSVKVPQSITHEVAFDGQAIDRFCGETAGLGNKLSILLVQLPPSNAFDEKTAGKLFDVLQRATPACLVCEPRHASWFTRKVDLWLGRQRIARVAADPARAPDADQPGGWPGLRYIRLHGSPRIYYSNYEADFLQKLGNRLRAFCASSDVWCIFDNTAAGAAMENALALKDTENADRFHSPQLAPRS